MENKSLWDRYVLLCPPSQPFGVVSPSPVTQNGLQSRQADSLITTQLSAIYTAVLICKVVGAQVCTKQSFCPILVTACML